MMRQVKDLVQALIKRLRAQEQDISWEPQKLEALLTNMLGESRYAQRQLLLSAGQLPEHLYYVAEGLLRGYCYDDASGRAITLYLWQQASWAVPLKAFMKRQPSDLYLEVMPGSVLLSLSYRQLAALQTQVPAVDFLLRELLLHYYAFHKKRSQDLLTRSAWERYLDLLQTHPRIEQQVSKEVISSYLGVTPQSLSRLIRENGHP